MIRFTNIQFLEQAHIEKRLMTGNINGWFREFYGHTDDPDLLLFPTEDSVR